MFSAKSIVRVISTSVATLFIVVALSFSAQLSVAASTAVQDLGQSETVTGIADTLQDFSSDVSTAAQDGLQKAKDSFRSAADKAQFEAARNVDDVQTSLQNTADQALDEADAQSAQVVETAKTEGRSLLASIKSKFSQLFSGQ